MKKLKLEHSLAQLVVAGKTSSTWRLFDDKDLSVDDRVLLIDKVDPNEPNTWEAIGIAIIDSVVQRRLGETKDSDPGYETFDSTSEMLAAFQRYYGSDVTLQTPVKIIHFHFSPEVPLSSGESLPNAEKVTVYADGGSRGNPGHSASGYVIFDDHKRVLVQKGVYLGITTNNQAEYTALKLALEEAKRFGAQDVDVFMDSLLVINQMTGVFKVKNRDLWPIHDTIKRLCRDFRQVHFTQVPREMNKLADAAVNQALDAQADFSHTPS